MARLEKDKQKARNDMNKRQKKKRDKLYDSGFGTWREKRRIDKSYKDFVRRVRRVQEKKDWVF